MKKFMGLMLATVMGVTFTMTAFAEGNTDKDVTFRDIPWYSTFTEAESLLESEGASADYDAWENKARRLSGIQFLSVMNGNDYVENGGVVRKYSGLSVAGYKPSEVGACYVYQIGENGFVDQTEENATFYFGWYGFDSNDYVDATGVYNDLLEKLTSIYGEGAVDDESEHYDTTAWVDPDGNKVRLLLGGLKSEKQYVSLGYYAAGGDEKLDLVQAALDAEAAANEASEREEQKDNVEGL